MNHVGTVLFQTFLVFAVCLVALCMACEAWNERQAGRAARAEWLRRLCVSGLLWRAR